MPSDYANDLMARVGLDTTEWKKGITELNAGIKHIETGFQASAALMDDWSNNSEGLKKRIESLNDKLALQKQKLDILKKAYDEEVAANGASSKAAEELAKKMYQTQAEIKRTRDSIEKYGKAEDEVASKTKNMIAQLEESGKKFEDVGQKISSVGNKMTLGVTTPILAAGTAIYKYSSDLTEAENKTEAVFGYMTDSVKEWASNSLDSFGMARSTAYDAVSLYGDMATSMGLTKGSAADMAMSLVELSADLSSFKNISLEQSQNALKSIFTGETETLKNLGIIMTETQLKAYAMSKGFEKSYTEMSQAEKVQLRYQYVLESSSNAIGDWGRTNGEAAGQMRLLPEALKELAASFRENVEPSITPIVTVINKAIVSFGKLDDGTKNFIVTTSLIVGAMGPLVSIIGKGVTATGKLSKAISVVTAAYKKKTKATAEDTAANTLNAESLDKTTKSSAAAAKSTSATAKGIKGIGGAAKSAMPVILAVAAELAVLAAIVNKVREKENKRIDDKYDKKKESIEKSYKENLEKLQKEYDTYDELQGGKIAAEEKYWNERIDGLEENLRVQKKAIDAEMRLYEKAHKERLSQLEKERDLKLKTIDIQEERRTSELQKQIDALNALTEAEEKAKEERENAEKLEDLKKAISRAKTYAEKLEAEKNYTAEVRRQEEEKTKSAREEEIKRLQNQISVIKTESDNKRNQINSEYQAVVELEQNKYDAAKESLDKRLAALDTFIEEETAKLEKARDDKLEIMRTETDNYLNELKRQIDEEERLKKEAIEKNEKAKEKAKDKGDVPKRAIYAVTTGEDRFQIAPGKYLPHNASGTNNWRGGLTWVNEEGGELINLPRGTQIIPHDVSMEAAREFGRQRAFNTTNNNTTNNSYNYGAQQQVNVFKVGDKTVAQAIEPAMSVEMSNRIYNRRRSGGVQR